LGGVTPPVPPTVSPLHRLRDARPGLVRLARRHSLCASDADDAVQRAFEILLRRSERVQPATALSWLRTVVKHEAMAIRSSRLRLLGGGDEALDAREAVEVPGPSERATDRERAHRALAALATLKRDEARALVLQAAGRTYAEIEAETGWSHTKVNRALTEGRAAFRTLVSALEAGDECARHAPLLRALARGRAPADAVVGLRAHLRACGACRARLAELR
jgi:RNA polymerase sigma factor (sigma-70 family)